MKRLLLLIFPLLLSYLLVAQVDARSGVFFKKVFTSKAEKTEETDIKGCPYNDKQFAIGKVKMTDGNTYSDIPLRYNIYLDRIEFQNDNVVYYISDVNKIVSVKFKNIEYVYTFFNQKGKISKSYFLLSRSGINKLLKKERVEFEHAEKAIAFQDAKRSRYKKMPSTFYLKFGDQPAVEIKKRKQIAALFPSHQSEIAKYVKKKKVGTRDAEELKQLLAYYEQICKE